MLTVIIKYVADKIVAQFIKEEGYGRIKKFFFPERNYKRRLSEIILISIQEFEAQHPPESNTNKYPFYHSQILFNSLSQTILFKKEIDVAAIEEFKTNTNIIIPSQDEIDKFYTIFIEKVRTDKELRKLYINENYKSEIYEISDEIKRISKVNNAIFSKLSSIDNQIAQLRVRYSEDVAIEKEYKIQGVEIYPKAEKISQRIELVTVILALLKKKTLVELHGGVSVGKTQLAVLVSEHFENKYWIDLKWLEPSLVTNVILTELAVKFTVGINIQGSINEIIRKIPENSIIILDDLPRIELHKREVNLLISLINECHKRSIKLLITSNFTIQLSIKDQIAESIYHEIAIPYLSETEIKEVLIINNATEEIANNLKGIIKRLTDGHPTIANTMVRYLSSINWQIDEQNLLGLFSGEYITTLQEDTYDRLLKTVFDEDTRDLLYRLKIIIGKIKTEEIDIVAAVNPNIKHPHEKVSTLIGLWLQKIKAGNYEISPLIKKINHNNLSPTLTQAINNALGNNILSKKSLDQIVAHNAIHYFIAAESFDKAGFVLSLALKEAIDNPDIFFDWGFNSFWLTVPLPEQMDLFMQSTIRYLQINILSNKAMDVGFLTDDLERIVENASQLGINMAPSALYLTFIYANKDTKKWSKFFTLAIKQFEELKVQSGKLVDVENLFDDMGISFETLIWSNLSNVYSLDTFNTWYTTLTKLTLEQIENSTKNDIYKVAVLVFCTRLYDIELEKSEPDWPALIESYNIIIEETSKYKLSYFISCCYKYQIRCYCACIGEVDKAIQILENNSVYIREDPVSLFLVYDELGRQLFYNKDNERALKYLVEADAITVPKIFTEKIDTYLVLSQIFGEKDKVVAHQFVLKANKFQENNEFVSDLFSAKIWGELGISTIKIPEITEAVYFLEKGLEKILFTYKPVSDYQAIIIRYGHVLNYCFHLLANRPLPKIESQEYVTPFRGFFLLTNDKILENGFYYEQRKFIVAFIVVQIFEQLNDLKMAKKWAELCFKLSEENFKNPFLSVLSSMHCYLILDNKYEESLLKETLNIKSINEYNSNLNEVRENLPSHLAKMLVDLPTPKFENFDELLFEHVFNFVVIKVIWDYLISNKSETIDKFLQDFQNISYYFNDKKPLLIIKTALEYLIMDEKGADDIIILQNESCSLPTQVRLLLYIIASLKAPIKKALQLHLALIPRLETISKKASSQAPYKFLVVPFLELYWDKAIQNRKVDFIEYEKMMLTGMPKVKLTAISNRLKELFRVLCVHLNYLPEEKSLEWLQS